MTPRFLDTPQGRRIAYRASPGHAPGVVFLGGFRSDMTGTKAVYLEEWARARGQAFLRFDYSGHGASSGRFEDGTIGNWAEDAVAAIAALCEGPQVLVGSSMGGWIALLAAERLGARVAGLVGIAAAPDFTEDGFWAGFDDAQRAELMDTGQLAIPSGYEDGPYIVTRRLIEEARAHLVLRRPMRLPFPVRLLQGTEDEAVATDVPLRLIRHAECADMRLTLVKGADHRFSDPDCLALIEASIAEVIARAAVRRDA